jgi:mannose-1-phosphate guanylyltransferase
MRVLGAQSLLEAALAHARRFAGPDCVWIVCTAENAAAIRAASGLPRARILIEPHGRNTAMAVGFAAARVAAVDADAVLAVLPADHVIPDARAFATALQRAARAAQTGALVTLGIQPTRPETGYGYIRSAPPGRAYRGLHRVRRFVEKPSAAVARAVCARAGICGTRGSSSGRCSRSSARSSAARRNSRWR